MRRTPTLLGLTMGLLLFAACQQSPPEAPEQGQSTTEESPEARGEYLVAVGGCNDCHTPKTFTESGPVPDPTRLLSGHPASEALPEIPVGIIAPDKWGAVTNNHLSAWVGPWGVSFTFNLTPDLATGLGSWTEEMFIGALRTGKHQGEGRDILPPMPWAEYRHMSDEDLGAIFAYLRSIPPIDNAVPDPIPQEDLPR